MWGAKIWKKGIILESYIIFPQLLKSMLMKEDFINLSILIFVVLFSNHATTMLIALFLHFWPKMGSWYKNVDTKDLMTDVWPKCQKLGDGKYITFERIKAFYVFKKFQRYSLNFFSNVALKILDSGGMDTDISVLCINFSKNNYSCHPGCHNWFFL